MSTVKLPVLCKAEEDMQGVFKDSKKYVGIVTFACSKLDGDFTFARLVVAMDVVVEVGGGDGGEIPYRNGTHRNKVDYRPETSLEGFPRGIVSDHDALPRPPKTRPAKKSKFDATASTGGSSASTQFGELMEQELRLKREAAERAFEAQAEKDRTLMRLEELRFLATSTKDLDDDDAYWIKKQKKLIKNKMKNDLGDEDDEDEDE
ncbi:hypothetical protein Tco_0134702 [Tanacetum coccineum]